MRQIIAISIGMCGVLGSMLMGNCSAAESTLSGREQAAAHGFVQLTFHNGAFGASNVDVHNSLLPGYSWYLWNFFSHQRSQSDITLNKDGSVSVAGERGMGTLVSATQTNRQPYFVGKAFGGGGYFEAEIAFDAGKVNTKSSWPAWWGLTLESVLNQPVSFWKGQVPGYRDTAELDIFEYDLANMVGSPNAYGAGMHHWYGMRGQCPPKPLCDYGSGSRLGTKMVVGQVDWSHYHKLGALWIPATDKTPGSMTFFFDGKQMGAPVSWTKFRDEPPPPSKTTPWSFAILDRMHLILVLNAGSAAPMSVRSVSVWQASDKNNLQN